MSTRYLLPLLALAISSSAFADFSIEGISAISTERGPMGAYSPDREEGAARFSRSDASDNPRQERYKDAELLVDLAYTPLSERGTGVKTIVDGFADDVPFATAMSMIVPRGWHIYKDQTLEAKGIPGRISFNGGKAWPEVLRDLGERYTLHFHLDWYDHTVMLKKGRPAPAMQAAQLAVIPEPAAVITKGVGATATNSSSPSINNGAVMIASGGSVKGQPALVTAGSPAPIVKPVVVKAPAPPKPAAPVIPTWNVSVADKTYREAVVRWARTAKWTFEPEHWTVPVDIPLTASATFRGDFKTAVQQLISTTELSETPLQPCFYSNHVVRIVPYNEMCDRMSAR